MPRPHFAPGGRAARASTWALGLGVVLFFANAAVTYVPGAWYPVTAVCCVLALPAVLHPDLRTAVLAAVVAVWAAGATVRGVMLYRDPQVVMDAWVRELDTTRPPP